MKSFILGHLLYIACVLLVLVIIEGLIIYVNWGKIKKKKGRKSKSTGTVSKEKYNEILEKLNASRCEAKQYMSKYNTTERLFKDQCRRYDEACKNIDSLAQEIKELTCENDELKKLVGIIKSSNAPETGSTVILSPKSESKEVPAENEATGTLQTPVQDDAKTEVGKEVTAAKEGLKTESPKEETKVEPAKVKTMYASFPRSAGSSIYFSDLSANRKEDSYFELIITIASGKATFRPMDFMRIRNYDPAMAAMRTEGVKPNVASTVIGIEPGMAHLEGNDWIIDNLAKIKLA